MRPLARLTLIVALAGVFGTTGAAQSARATAQRVERGELAKSDETLESGEYVDAYSFRWQANQRVTIELISKGFDGYLILVPPKGEQLENDDADDDDPSRSLIEADLAQTGTYQVLVTSYDEGEVGSYSLRVSTGGARRTATADRSISYGQTREDELEQDDDLSDKKFVDAYAFTGRAGERIVVEMASEDIDTYLTLIPPDGAEIENDDAGSDTDLSRISLTLRESGRYRILASSYDNHETGLYTLSLRRTGTGKPDPDPRTPARASTIYGVFVGISDYEGDDDDLEYTADDARNIQQALAQGAGLRAADAMVLVDRAATRAGVMRAIEEVGRRAGPDDLFVFFFSGHGDRIERKGTQPADPDGLDETITLYDGEITDDEMSRLLAPIRGRVLLALDSCFSGGFSKDVISSPRRMGLFSSEEDITSGVADKFRAGGYLSKFMADAIGDGRADKDKSRDITAIELSQYLHERYRTDVRSPARGSSGFARSSGPETGYQHLVVDRGSVAPFDVLFSR
jgi:hypothetical protein